MIFENSIRFKHGTLRRGDECLYRQWPATYMGTYIENDRRVYMMRVHAYYRGEYAVIEEYIAQTTEKNDIVCHQQQRQPEEGQMRLC